MLDRIGAIFANHLAAGRITTIDGLRGVAAALVCVHHFSNTIAQGRHDVWLEPFQTIADHGWAGVQVFFVLSGFVIAHSVRGHRITWSFFGRFALRRALRLDPSYWTVILISLSVLYVMGGERAERMDLTAVAANMLYVDNIVGLPSLVKVG